MNLRELCGISGYPTAVLTTFNFDPLFFERVVLRDLRDAGSTRIIVLADAVQSVGAIAAVREQLVGLGRQYQLFPVWMRGAFHPKVCLRLSPSAALVACGSTNLTRPGWLGLRSLDGASGNREVAAAWQVESGTPEAANVRFVLRVLEEVSMAPPVAAAVREAAGSWGTNGETIPDGAGSLLMSHGELSLAKQIEQRWSGRRFTRLRMGTGSTDAGGAMIRWAHRTFGIEEVVLEVDPGLCGFEKAALADLPVNLQIRTREVRPRPHLKVALWEGLDGAAAVFGSANCSAAGWLVPPARGGNVEAVVALDQCSAEDFNGTLDLSDSQLSPWKSVSFAGLPERERMVPLKGIRLIHMELWRSQGVLRAVFDSPIDRAEIVTLTMGDVEVRAYARPDGAWEAVVGPSARSAQTDFGSALIGEPGTHTDVCWINDVDELESLRGSQAPGLRAFGGLARSGGTDSLQTLQGLAQLAHWVLTREAAVDDERLSMPSAGHDESQSNASVSVSADEVFRSWNELRRSKSAPIMLERHAGVSLGSLMRALFGEGAPQERTGSDDVLGDESRVTSATTSDEDVETNATANRAGESDDNEVTPEDRRRLIRQLERFVDRLSHRDFGEVATAQQLQDATAFGLGSALLAGRGGWVMTSDERERWGKVAFQIVESLLHPTIGLIARVRERYDSVGMVGQFDAIVGDGSLWAVMMAALTSMGTDSPTFERDLALHDIATCSLLSTNASPERIAALMDLLSTAADDEGWIADAARAHSRIGSLIARLQTRGIGARPQLTGEGKTGDWLWKSTVGFARLETVSEAGVGDVYLRSRRRVAKKVHLHLYVNLRTAGLIY